MAARVFGPASIDLGRDSFRADRVANRPDGQNGGERLTRPGAGSVHGNILLLLPERLVRHVFLHELCHMKQMDHSPKFWSLFGEIESNYKSLEAEVRNADKYVPPWLRLT